MPLFDFRCAGCGHVFEALVRPHAEALACPDCEGTALERQPATFAVRSAERTVASASAARRKAAATGRADNVVKEREMHAHRKEDF